ncbi:MAG: AMP-binding protein [Flavobacteriales bacterium]
MSERFININGVKFDCDRRDIWEHESKNEFPEYIQNVLSFCKEWFDERPFVVVKTSGSTGTPKEIKLPKTWMQISALKSINAFEIKQKSNLLLSLPVSFIAGKLMIVRAIVSESNLICVQPEAKPQLPQEEIHFAAFTPMQVQYLLDHQSDLYSKIDSVIIGGGAISESLWQQISMLTNRSYATYGMTETSTHIAYQHISATNRRNHFSLIDSSIIINLDERGCVHFEVPYFDNLKVQTNDLALLIDENSFELLGRIDRVVNSGGRKIQVEELEELITSEIQWPFYLCGKPDDLLGEKLVLMVETGEGIQSNEFFESAFNKLSKLDQPKEIHFRKKFTYTHTGKVIKKYFDE